MREWASGEWKDASDANFDLSLSHPELLAEVKAADYLPFIEQGEHAAYFGGDLLNVIGRRAVMARKDYKAKEDREAVAGYCAKMLQEYRSRRNREAELLVLLDSLAQSSDEMVGETNRFVWEASSEERERKELDKGDMETIVGCSIVSVICLWQPKFICNGWIGVSRPSGR